MSITASCPLGEMYAVCQLMGLNLKRCQVVRGHKGRGGHCGQSEVLKQEDEPSGVGVRVQSIRQTTQASIKEEKLM